MSKELFFIGQPVEFKTGIKIYPPTVKDVVNNKKYGAFLQVLTYSQEEIEDIYVQEKMDLSTFPTPMEFMLGNCFNNKAYEKICKDGFQFFLKQEVDFLYEQKIIIVGGIENVLKELKSLDELVTITEEEFFRFQNLIRMAGNLKILEPPKPDEHPKVKAMKAKARYRDKIKAQQNAKNGITLFTSMSSICCMGLGITPLNIGEMSYVAMNAILNQYQSKERYMIDIESLMAGADSKSVKPKYWIRNLEED